MRVFSSVSITVSVLTFVFFGCGSGTTVSAGFSCGDDADCGAGMRCVQGFQFRYCVPATCARTGDCGVTGFRCDNGMCVTGCLANADCDDGLFCNGVERCDYGHPSSDTRGCRTGAAACPSSLTCDEAENRCVTTCVGGGDVDGDGAIGIACGGDDCDDNDPLRYPGAVEICDVDDRDEDCDPTTFGARDGDADGYVDARCCNMGSSGGSMTCGEDCDDSRPWVHPDLPEVCNGFDDDCDGIVDDRVDQPYYLDADGDGFGTGTPVYVCAPNTVQLPGDCDDKNPAIVPGAMRCVGTGVEICRGGTFMAAACGVQQVCRPQPNGTGVCL